MLSHAYAIEVFILATALATAGFIAWMIRDRWSDYSYAVEARAPAAWLWTGLGGVVSEGWRLLTTALLVWIAWWMVWHPPPASARAFFDPVQFSAGRNIIALLVIFKGMASFTDRWYRRRARLANGIRGVRR